MNYLDEEPHRFFCISKTISKTSARRPAESRRAQVKRTTPAPQKTIQATPKQSFQIPKWWFWTPKQFQKIQHGGQPRAAAAWLAHAQAKRTTPAPKKFRRSPNGFGLRNNCFRRRNHFHNLLGSICGDTFGARNTHAARDPTVKSWLMLASLCEHVALC